MGLAGKLNVPARVVIVLDFSGVFEDEDENDD